MNQDKLSNQIKSLAEKVSTFLGKLKPYGLATFAVFVILIYGFLLLRTSALNNRQPDPDTVAGNVKAARLPHIDQSVVKQLQTLRDNSVSVRALFDQSRSNPFQ